MTAREQNPSWRHHHVPEFYLKQWAGPDGRLLRYHRVSTGRLVERSTTPKSTGFEPALYNAPPITPYEKWAPDIIEKQVMAPLDDAAAKVLVKLTADSVSIALDDADRKAWARFLNSLLERHPRELAERDAIAEGIAEKLVAEYRDRPASAEARERVERALSIFDHRVAARNMVRSAMVHQINDETFLDHLVGQHRFLIVAPVGDPFITSDRPLLVNAGMTESRPVYVLTLPLSPRHLFVS